MIYSSLAILALSASSALGSIPNPVHVHHHAAVADARINITLLNESRSFQDVNIAGHMYTILPGQKLLVKAPIGTVVVAASSTGGLHQGDVVTSLTPDLQNQSIVMK